MPEPDTEFLESYLPEKVKTAIIVGASDGRWCKVLSPIAMRVIAIEPNPESIINLTAIKQPNVEIVGKAAWITGNHNLPFHVRSEDRSASALACRDINRSNGVTSTVEVPTIAIDDLNISDADLIIVDVEGAELDVLRGATQTIERCKPDVMIECHERENRLWLADWLERCGYNLAHVHDAKRNSDDQWGRFVHLIGQYYRRS